MASHRVAVVGFQPTSAQAETEDDPGTSGDDAAEDSPTDTPEADTPEETPAEPSETTVRLKDGQSVTGLLVEQTESKIILRIRGIDTPFERRTVERIETLPSVEQRYREMRATIQDDDSDRLMLLVNWLMDRQRYSLARDELEGILKRRPDHAGAAEKLSFVRKQLDLIEKSRQAKARANEARAQRQQNVRKNAFPLLTTQQAAKLKVFEVDLTTPPRMRIRGETIRALIDGYRDHPAMPATEEGRQALFRKPGHEILELMFRVRARELYDQVELRELPRPLSMFRKDVHEWIRVGCASNRCHGGAEAGRLYLNGAERGSEVAVLTNLFILDQFRLADGTPLINYEEPAKSPLLQMALPREEATRPHPMVTADRQRWKPAIRSRDDPKFERALAWMRSMYRPRPEYGIDFVPPRPPSAEAGEKAGTRPGER
ncbi:MAG: hypothetical protein SFZ23_12980 [Planctomycetota bacterium]|nr:hypothetical protein [Planctomycetota bacterium]